MLIGNLTIRIGADARGIPRDLAPIGSQLTSLETQAGNLSTALATIKAPTGEAIGPAVDQAQPAEAMRAALTPLLGIGDRIAVMLNRTGGTIVTLARRIDDAMKTPLTLRALEALQKRFEGTWTGAAAGAAAAAAKIKSYLSSIGDVARRDLTQVSRLSFGSSLTGLLGIRQATAAIAPAARVATGAVRTLGREIAIATGVFGVAFGVVSFFREAVSGASALNETVSKTGVIFGDSVGIVTSEADRLAKAFGLNKRETLEAASNFGIMAKAAGLAQKDAAALANQLVQDAADAASINNLTVEETLAKIRSGLAGEAEPLRTLGVMLTEAAVKAEAARLGIARLGAELTEGQKITARASLIHSQLAYATGDLERTLTGPANQFRSLTGTIANLSASIGQSLMPIIQPATMALAKMASLAAEGFESIRPQVEAFATAALPVVVEGIAKVADALDFVWRQLEYGWPVIQDIFGGLKSLATAAANGIQAVARYALDAARSLAEMGLSAARTVDSLTGSNLAKSLEGLPGQIAATAKKISDAWQHAAPGGSLGDKIREFFAGIGREVESYTDKYGNVWTNQKPQPKPPESGIAAAAPTPPKEITALETKLRSDLAQIGKQGGIEDDINKLKETRGYQDPQFAEVRALQKQLDLAKGRIEAEKELNALAKETIAATLTPIERYNARVNELKTLLDTGKIDSETFNRASAASYRETMGPSNRFAGAATKNSREAYSAIINDLGRRNEDPVKVTAKNTEKQLTESQKQTAFLQRMVDLLAGRLNGESMELFALGS